MPGNNDTTYSFDNRSVLAAIKQINEAQSMMEKNTVGGAEKMSAALENFGKVAVRVTDKAVQNNERYVRSLEQQAAAAGKTGTEKLIAQRDAIIKRLGTEKDQVDRVTAAYAKLIKIQEQGAGAETGGGGGSGVRRFAFLGAKDLLEGRTTNAIAETANVLTKLGGTALAVGGVATAIIGLGVAGAEAVRSLASFGTEFKNIQERTGFTTQQVSAFGFAAKAVGQDVSIVDRLMRGLSQATEELGPSGDKARQTLADIGVRLTDINGQTRPTAELLTDISGSFAKLAPGTKLSADAMDLFKRAGVEAIPFLRELKANAQYFESHGLPSPTQEDINKFTEYERKIAAVDTRWEAFKRGFKDVAATVFLTAVEDRRQDVGLTDQGNRFRKGSIRQSLLGGGAPLPDLVGDTLRAQQQTAAGFARGAPQQVEFEQAAQRAAAFLSAGTGSNIESARLRESQLRQDLDKARNQLESKTGGFQSEAQGEQRVNAATVAYQRQLNIVKQLEKAESLRNGRADELLRLQKQSADLLDRANASTGEIGKLQKERQDARNQLGLSIARDPGLLSDPTARAVITRAGGAIEATYGKLIIDETIKERSALANELQAMRQEVDAGLDKSFGKNVSGELLGPKDFAQFGVGAFEQTAKSLSRISDIEFEGNKQLFQQQFGQAGRVASASRGSGNQIDAARQAYQERISLAQQLTQIEINRINQTSSGNERDVLAAQKRVDLTLELSKAEEEYQLKVAETIRQQTEGIKKTVEPLVTTLFTNPSKFGSQLGSTLKTAAFKPITEGISEQIAVSIRPLIYGATGTGGLAGALSGKGSIGAPLIPAASALTYAANALISAAGAISSSGGGSGGGFFGGGTSSSGLPYFSGSPSALGIPGGAFSDIASIVGGPGGTSGFTGPVSFGAENSSAPGSAFGGGFAGGGRTSSGGGAAGLLGLIGSSHTPGGGGLAGGFKSTFGNIKGLFTGGGGVIGSNFSGYLHPNSGGYAGEGTLGTLSRGPFQDTALGSLATGLGVGLAEHGLLGNQRGTFAGTLQGAAGGFLVAGPIGAAVGFSIGLGEQLAGVESPRNEAKRLVQDQYHISINNNMADKIVQISQQSYGSRVSVAVRSPEVRQMLGLYAAGTGQANKFPASADLPHGASLINQGGTLYQGTTYQYGNQYAIGGGNLPVLGSGGNVNNLPVPGGPTYLSFNVGGSDAASFMTGSFVTPSFVQSQQAAAWGASNGRTAAAMTVQQPGSIIA